MRTLIVLTGVFVLGLAPSALCQVSQTDVIVRPATEDFSGYVQPGAPGIVYPEMRNRNDVGELLSSSYPAESMAAREQGNSVVAVCINAEGQVTRASIWGSSGYARLDEAAKEAVFKIKFRPAQVAGKSVPFCSMTVELAWTRSPWRMP